MAEYISLRAYARRRGVVLSAVQKAIESRRVTAIREEDGRISGIDPIEADKQWAANTDATEAAKSGKFVDAPPTAQLTPPPSEKPAEPTAAGDQGTFLAARVKEAELRGQLLELDKLERIDDLLPRSVVAREYAEIFAQLNNALTRIPDRISQALAGETDPVRINRRLSDEIRKVLDECSRRLAEAAGVADDAGVAAERPAILP